MCHIFFVHFSVSGQLGYFPVLAIVNRYMPRSGLAGTHHSYILIHTVLHSDCTIYIPTDSGGGFPSLLILSSIYCL